MKGQIKKINYSKNYGFIKTEKGDEVFFHKSELAAGLIFQALEKGEMLRFFVENTNKGKKATHIIKSQ